MLPDDAPAPTSKADDAAFVASDVVVVAVALVAGLAAVLSLVPATAHELPFLPELSHYHAIVDSSRQRLAHSVLLGVAAVLWLGCRLGSAPQVRPHSALRGVRNPLLVLAMCIPVVGVAIGEPRALAAALFCALLLRATRGALRAFAVGALAVVWLVSAYVLFAPVGVLPGWLVYEQHFSAVLGPGVRMAFHDPMVAPTSDYGLGLNLFVAALTALRIATQWQHYVTVIVWLTAAQCVALSVLWWRTTASPAVRVLGLCVIAVSLPLWLAYTPNLSALRYMFLAPTFWALAGRTGAWPWIRGSLVPLALLWNVETGVVCGAALAATAWTQRRATPFVVGAVVASIPALVVVGVAAGDSLGLGFISLFSAGFGGLAMQPTFLPYFVLAAAAIAVVCWHLRSGDDAAFRVGAAVWLLVWLRYSFNRPDALSFSTHTVAALFVIVPWLERWAGAAGAAWRRRDASFVVVAAFLCAAGVQAFNFARIGAFVVRADAAAVPEMDAYVQARARELSSVSGRVFFVARDSFSMLLATRRGAGFTFTDVFSETADSAGWQRVLQDVAEQAPDFVAFDADVDDMGPEERAFTQRLAAALPNFTFDHASEHWRWYRRQVPTTTRD